jgi:hypothetical protein
MEYLLLIYGDETSRAGMTPAEHAETFAAYRAYTRALTEAGVMRDGRPLQGRATAATVRLTASGPQVLDGPYAETKEQLGGFYLIDVPDQDAALHWAARCPGAAAGIMEVRPVMAMPS